MPPVARPAADFEGGEPEDTPQAWAQLWAQEFAAARDALRKWQERARKIDQRFRDERSGGARDQTRWNLFTANVRLQQATLYGKTPQVSVNRRFADAKDDVARVAGELTERLLNTDIERDGDGCALALQCATNDYLLPGLGNARVRYVLEEEDVEAVPAKLGPSGEVLAPEVPAGKRKVREDVEVDYVHWEDQLWSPARVWQEVRWWAFRAEMSRAQLVERFGPAGRLIPLGAKRAKGGERGDKPAKPSPWARAEVWEIWDKERRRVFWFVEGYDKTLGPQDAPEQGFAEDPLELPGFWPFPRPMAANLTNSAFVPVPDFVLAQDLYNEIDHVSTKITELQDALVVRGIYDSANEGIQQLLEAGGRNKLIPAKNWGRLAEKGGLKGVVDWMPLEQIAAALDKLRDYRAELVNALDQIEGTSDLMRGQGANVEETARATGIKAQFGSVRLQAKQDELARFASELLGLKAHVIARFFDAETILARSNAEYLVEDPGTAQRAVELIKSRMAEYRVQVKPENVSLTDFAALKQESLEVLAGISSFVQNIGQFAKEVPGSMPFLLELLQWSIGRLRGASTAEAILDRAVTQAKQAAAAAAAQPQAQQPDPKVVAAQLKLQGEQQRAAMDSQEADRELQRDLVRQQAEVSAEQQKQQAQTVANIQEERARTAIKLAARPPPVAPVRVPTTGGVR